ncbi:MAG: type II secretion system protein [Oscillatoriales cyanobacterium]|nr:MAG: type II secretion system protein [Oscillatoriales cyanobacterium]TAH25960.1 MAG: type II secretion system protein [Oscillatoriales cyanobacterium]
MIKRQQIQSLDKSQEAGYTIIESLVAMIVVSVLMIAIAPVMAYSVATRVQAKRIEMATQAAKTYIEALRSEALKQGTQGFPTQYTTNNQLENTPAPANSNALYCIDNDGKNCTSDSNQGLLVQGYYFNKSPATTDPTRTGYSLIVRVYRAGAFKDGGTLTTQKKQADQNIQVQQGISSAGLGNLKAPLVEIRTEIGATDRQGAYNSFCDRIPDGCKQ